MKDEMKCKPNISSMYIRHEATYIVTEGMIETYNWKNKAGKGKRKAKYMLKCRKETLKKREIQVEKEMC